MKTLKKYWHLFWKFRALRLMLLVEYRVNFIFWTVISIMWTIFNYFFFSLLLGVRGEIGGWSNSEMYILLSTFTMLDAFVWSFFYHNMQEYTSSIFNGQMTMTLTRPVSTQFLVSLQTNSYTNIPRFLIGLTMLIKTAVNARISVSFSTVFLYLAFFCLSLLFIYSLWFLVATCTFWVEKLDNINDVVPNSRRVWQLPREVFQCVFSLAFTIVLPLSLISSLPSELFLGRAQWEWILYFVLFTFVLFLTSRWFFLFSLRKYAGIAN
jgi:ABC-2 type transport system permease protein